MRPARRGMRSGQLGRWLGPGGWLGLGLALAAVPAGAEDLRGRAALSYLSADSSDGGSSKEFRQLYELSLQRQVSDTLSFNLSLSYQGDDGHAQLLGQRSRLASRLLRPTFGLQFKDGPWTAAVNYDYVGTWAVDPVTGSWPKRDLQTGRALLEYMPGPAFRANLSADVYTASAEGSGPTRSNRLGTLLEWTPSGTFRLTQANQLLTFESGGGAVKRLSYGPQLQAQYEGLLGKRLALSLRSDSQYLRSEDTLQAGGSGSVEVDEFPLLAYSGHSELPIEPPAIPPTQNPTLIDRDFTASTGVDLGPAGASFWNLSVDMGRVLALDRIRVHVRDRSGAPVPSGGLVSWSAYSSSDGQRWVELLGATFAFDPDQSLYAVAFPRTSARYFKVVNFGTNLIDTLVTELQVSAMSDVNGVRRRVSDSFRQALQGGVSLRLGEKLVLSYQGLLNLNYAAQQGSGVAGAWGRDATQTGSAALGPYGDVTFTTTLGMTTARFSPSSSQDSATAALQARYEPIPRFSASAGVNWSSDQAAGVRGTTRSALLESRLRLWEAIRLMASTSLTRQLVSGSTSDFVGATAQADVDLLRNVALRASAQLSHQVSDGPLLSPGVLPIPVTQQFGLYYAEVRARSGEALQLSARLGYTDSPAGHGLNQNYRAEWSPFPGGAIQLAMNVEQAIDPLAGRRFQSISLWPRWVVNWYAVLDLNYNMTIEKLVTGARRQSQLQLMLTLTY